MTHELRIYRYSFRVYFLYSRLKGEHFCAENLLKAFVKFSWTSLPRSKPLRRRKTCSYFCSHHLYKTSNVASSIREAGQHHLRLVYTPYGHPEHKMSGARSQPSPNEFSMWQRSPSMNVAIWVRLVSLVWFCWAARLAAQIRCARRFSICRLTRRRRGWT